MNCVSIAPDNGLSPVRRQAIIWTNAVLLLIGPLAIILRPSKTTDPVIEQAYLKRIILRVKRSTSQLRKL